MTNQLSQETSPYLLQHAENPVDWYPWSEQALAKARQEEKPIFLSIGYSACHWCHVMEHESFEDQQTAQFLNDHFVSIKVDREERPDLDQVYMNAVQIMTGHGGWPMSMFLLPDTKPFFGGTYWPPEERMGMPSFRKVLETVLDAWQNRRDQLSEQAATITQHLQQVGLEKESTGTLREELLVDAGQMLKRIFDSQHGGFGSAPKFPHTIDLQLLLRMWRRQGDQRYLQMVELSLDKMAQSGMFDQLSGGFARYTVDAKWLVPHFEKMLYDNALLTGAYLDGYLATGHRRHAEIARRTLDYVLNDMTDPSGGFHSAEDADSEGEEGKFYVWSVDEVRQVLGRERAEKFCYVYDVTEEGNFEGHNILHLAKTFEQCAALKGWDPEQLAEELAGDRKKLLDVREQRIRPGKDDKILVGCSALMIDSLARAAGILEEPRYLQAATTAAEFICSSMIQEDDRLLHSWRSGQAKLMAYLDDYAYLINALITLYESGFQERWIDRAVCLADIVMKHFRDKSGGGFFYTADDHETLIARNKDYHDSSVPSACGMLAASLLRLGKLCGRADYLVAATETLDGATSLMEKSPAAAGQMLLALDTYLDRMPEIVVLGNPEEPATAAILADLRKRFLPNRVIACRSQADVEGGSPEIAPIFIGKVRESQSPTVYVCEKFACQAPVCGQEAVIATWEKLTVVRNG